MALELVHIQVRCEMSYIEKDPRAKSGVEELNISYTLGLRKSLNLGVL